MPGARPSRVEPFTIHILDEVLSDLRVRIENTRWPVEVFADDWTTGTSAEYLRGLLDYWDHGFDWRAQEQQLNDFPHFRVDIEDFVVHFIHSRGEGAGRVPLILSHGWPNTFADMLKLVPLLEDDFDLVIPSVPGYGFSEIPPRPWAFRDVPRIWHLLMTEELGYRRYGALGYDIGAWITGRLAVEFPESLVGIHVTSIPGKIPEGSDIDDAERRYLAAAARWEEQDAAYSYMQETRPSTVTYGLHDSPVGLAGWIVEKLREWSDCNGDIEKRWSRDEICLLLTIYWATGTIGPSFRVYYDRWQDPEPDALPQKPPEVPAGFALFPKDILRPPRAHAERAWKVARWTEMPRGGHFPPMEEPGLLSDDISAFFGSLR